MLKIKDNVDLKELEKFGLKPKYDEDTGKIYKYIYEYEFCGTKKVSIEIQKDFYMQGQYNYIEYWKVELIEFEGLDKIYDLIQARIGRKGVDMEEYARTKFGFYKVIGKYERNRGNDLCVKLGDFYTGEFEGEEYESNLKLGNLIDLIEVRRLCE